MIPEPVALPGGLRFRVERRFAASRERVFRAWTDPEALKLWWCPKGWAPAGMEIDLRVGGQYRLGMRKVEGGPPVFAHGSFLEVRCPERLVYTWNWENAFPQMPQTRVTVQFGECGGATEVILIHENLPEIPLCLQHRNGWIAALDRMRASLAGV